MAYSLQSRDLIADGIETMMASQFYDANLAIPGCDKNMPGCVMAMGRVNRRAAALYVHRPCADHAQTMRRPCPLHAHSTPTPCPLHAHCITHHDHGTRHNRPSVMVYGGTIRAGCRPEMEEKLDIISAFQAYGQFVTGQIEEEERLTLTLKPNPSPNPNPIPNPNPSPMQPQPQP